jgi:hypothetical protein
MRQQIETVQFLSHQPRKSSHKKQLSLSWALFLVAMFVNIGKVLLVKMPKTAALSFLSLTPLGNATANRNGPIFVASAKEVRSQRATLAVLGIFSCGNVSRFVNIGKVLLVKMPNTATCSFLSLIPLGNATANRNCPIFFASAKEVRSQKSNSCCLGHFFLWQCLKLC